jgi:hypothetical protein
MLSTQNIVKGGDWNPFVTKKPEEDFFEFIDLWEVSGRNLYGINQPVHIGYLYGGNYFIDKNCKNHFAKWCLWRPITGLISEKDKRGESRI